MNFSKTKTYLMKFFPCFARIFIFLIIFGGVFGVAEKSKAADWYVNLGAVGSNSGISWMDAWSELDQISWDVIQPGDFIEIASGNYSTSLSISSSGTSIDPISVVKTQDIGYAGQININNVVSITGSHIIFDGVMENGIRLAIPNTGAYIDSHYLTINEGDDVVVRNIEISGPGYDMCHAARGINTNSDNVLIEHLYIHDFSAVAMRLIGNSGFAVRNSHLHNIGSKGDVACQAERGMNIHYEHIAVFDGVENFELGNSLISQEYENDLEGGFGISFASMSGGYSRIHGNVFFNVSYPIYINSDGMGNVNEYTVNGNTFLGYRVPVGTSTIPTDSKNNIFCNLDNYFSDYNTRGAYTGGSYNLYCDDDRYRSSYQSAENSQVLAPGEQPFIDYLSDWRLKYPTNHGDELTSFYSIDFSGNLRGVDNVWDRGAYEYFSADITAPVSPSGLSVY